MFDAILIGGGDILRKSQNVPDHVRRAMSVGNLAPTEAYLSTVLPYLSKIEYMGKPIIMSSLGRWHGEEKAILESADKANHPIKAVILLDLDENEAKARAQSRDIVNRGNRADDALEYLHTRFDEFRAKTVPVIDYYKKLGLLIEVNGQQQPADVTSEILQKLERYASKN